MPELRVVTQNIWGINDQWQQRTDAIGRNMVDLGVDVVCIQESTPDHFEVLKSQSFSSFPHACYAPADDGSLTPGPLGLAMFSRLPLLDTGKLDIGRERDRRHPWMRILQYMTLATPSGHSLTVFNTHLSLSDGQKAGGIGACLDFMRREQFADCQHHLTGDFNINLDTQPQYLTPLAEHGYADLWSAKNGGETGYTCPWRPDRPLARRIDGHFMQRDMLDRVVSVSRVNTEAIVDGSLLLSDHVGVMATIAQ